MAYALVLSGHTHALGTWPWTEALNAPGGGRLWDVMLLPSLIFAPVSAAVGPVFASNLWVVVSLLAIGACTRALAMEIGGDARTATVAGFLAQGAPYLYGYPLYSGVHERLGIWLFPFLILCGLKLRGGAGRPWALFGVVAYVFVASGCGVYGIWAVLLLGVAAPFLRRPEDRWFGLSAQVAHIHRGCCGQCRAPCRDEGGFGSRVFVSAARSLWTFRDPLGKGLQLGHRGIAPVSLGGSGYGPGGQWRCLVGVVLPWVGASGGVSHWSSGQNAVDLRGRSGVCGAFLGAGSGAWRTDINQSGLRTRGVGAAHLWQCAGAFSAGRCVRRIGGCGGCGSRGDRLLEAEPCADGAVLFSVVGGQHAPHRSCLGNRSCIRPRGLWVVEDGAVVEIPRDFRDRSLSPTRSFLSQTRRRSGGSHALHQYGGDTVGPGCPIRTGVLPESWAWDLKCLARETAWLVEYESPRRLSRAGGGRLPKWRGAGSSCGLGRSVGGLLAERSGRGSR